MRVFHCIPSLGGGGAERQLCYFVEQLVKKNIEVHVAYLHEGKYSERLRNSGATLHHVSSKDNYDIFIIKRLLSLFLMVKPNLIQLWLPQMVVMGSIASILLGKPYIICERNSNYEFGWRRYLARFLSLFSCAIIANSYAGVGLWDRLGFRSKPKFVVPNAICVSEIVNEQYGRSSLPSLREGFKFIVFAGRYTGQKNLDNLIDAMNEVLDHRVNIIFSMYGDGPLFKHLEIKKSTFSNKDRIFINQFSNDVWSVMKRADIFVSVSWYEGSPNTVLEAIACRCRLVISDIPAHREILSDEWAIFVDPNDSNSIADGILNAVDLADMDIESNLNSAFKILENRSPEEITMQYLEIYKNLYVE